MQAINHYQSNVFVRLKELCQASHSQIKINCSIALKQIEVLQYCFDEVMFIVSLLLTLVTAHGWLYPFVQAIQVIIATYPLYKFV